MNPLTAQDIRASLVNCTKGEATRLTMPRDLAAQPWEDLDFLGWRDPSGADRGCIVAESGEGLVGVVLRCVSLSARARFGGGRVAGGRVSMCSLCLTTHPGTGVTLMTAPRRAKKDNSLGIRLCADFACSLYVRGKKSPPAGGRFAESLSMAEQTERLRENLFAFLTRV
jgi:hypothetical protein